VTFTAPAEIFGMDGMIVLIVVVLVLFGSTQIPKLARSIGSAQKEFKEGSERGESSMAGKVSTVVPPVVVASQPVSLGASARQESDNA
jgi:sec-independent protein translocase protein TatA